MNLETVNGTKFSIDCSDAELIMRHRWYVDKRSNYIFTSINKKTVQISRLLTGAPRNLDVDHIDGNPLNNRRNNLRVCTTQQNCMNRAKHKIGSSKFKGVHKLKANDRFQSHIKYNGKKFHIGTYKTETEAALQYNRYAKRFFGEYAKLNEVN